MASRMNALQRHLSKAARRKAQMLRSGELPPRMQELIR